MAIIFFNQDKEFSKKNNKYFNFILYKFFRRDYSIGFKKISEIRPKDSNEQ